MTEKNTLPNASGLKIARTHMPEQDAELRSHNF